MSKQLLFLALAIVSLAVPAFAAEPSDAQSAFCWLRDASFKGGSVMLLCEDGRLMSSNDAGAHWATYTISSNAWFNALAFLDENHGFAAGQDGLLMSTDDAGKTWKRIETGSQQHIAALAFYGQQGWMSGYDGVIMHSSDRGKTWQKQAEYADATIESLFFFDDNFGFAVGWQGLILRTLDGGKSWEQIPVAEGLDNYNLSSVFFRDKSNGWAVGSAGLILTTSDGGKTWKSQQSGTLVDLTSVAFDANGRGWIAAEYNLFESADQGRTWKVSKVTPPGFVQKVAVQGGVLWAMGTQYVVDRKPQEAAWHEQYSYMQAFK